MSELVCKGITKRYKDKEALRGVDLTLESGKIYGLIGRNGAGKTTLLSILAAQNPATAGTVTLDGEAVWENRQALDRLCFSRELNIAGNSGVAADPCGGGCGVADPDVDAAGSPAPFPQLAGRAGCRLTKVRTGLPIHIDFLRL